MGSVSNVMFLTAVIASSSQAVVTVDRSGPFPTYYVGDSASITISTHPPQPFADVFVWRRLDGDWIAEGALLGTTDANGRWTNTVDPLPAEAIGSYSDEQFAVGDVSGPRSTPLAYSIRPLPAAPTVVRGPPFPVYQAGGPADLWITTDPPEPLQPVYRWLRRDGLVLDDGVWIGYTDSAGTLFRLVDPLPESAVGSYSGERFAVARRNAARSSPMAYTILPPPPPEPPIVVRDGAFPNYHVGGSASLELSTAPAQPFAAVYTWKWRDGVFLVDAAWIGTTDASGRFSNFVAALPASSEGDYVEEFAVGEPTHPRSSQLAYTIHTDPYFSPPAVNYVPPRPDYIVGATVRVTIESVPPTPSVAVYRWPEPGLPEGEAQLVGRADGNGRLIVDTVITIDELGGHPGEVYAIGSPANGRSTAVPYTVRQLSAVSRGLSVLHHREISMHNAEVDGILGAASAHLQSVDGEGDFACPLSLSRDGDVGEYFDAPGTINTQQDYLAVLAQPANVMVVAELNWCGVPGPGFVGCAPVPGSSFIVERRVNSTAGTLWAHEHGHNQGLSHSPSTAEIMFAVVGDRRFVTFEQCLAFLD